MRLSFLLPTSIFVALGLLTPGLWTLGLASPLMGQSVDSTCLAMPVAMPVRGEPIALFDQETLEGWTTQSGEPSNNWTIDDGVVFRKSSGGDLYHKHWYRDFELTFEWKTTANGNSGIKYRVVQYGKALLGCEYQLQDDKKNLFDRHATGSIYAIHAPNQSKVLNPVGQWNQSKIVVCGEHVEHWLNDHKVVEATIGSPDWLTRVEKSKFRKREHFGQNREGRIFLQDHGTDIWFRKMMLVPLDCDNTARSSAGL